MKKILTLTVGLMIVASAAMAQSGLYLANGTCASAGGTTAVTNACTSNSGSAMNWVCSVILPHPELNFISAGTVLDVATAAALPNWWRLDGAGCRPAALTAVMDGTAGVDCATVWDSGPSVGVFQAQVGNMTTPALAANRLRLNAVGALVTATDLTNTTDELAVCKFAISRALSTGGSACAGCTTPASFYLNEINFLPNSSQGDVVNAADVITNPGTPGATTAVYNGGSGQPTPTANHTWGSIKALYR